MQCLILLHSSIILQTILVPVNYKSVKTVDAILNNLFNNKYTNVNNILLPKVKRGKTIIKDSKHKAILEHRTLRENHGTILFIFLYDANPNTMLINGIHKIVTFLRRQNSLQYYTSVIY